MSLTVGLCVHVHAAALYQCDPELGSNLYDYRKETDCPVITLVIKLRHYLCLCSRPSAVVGMDGQLR